MATSQLVNTDTLGDFTEVQPEKVRDRWNPLKGIISVRIGVSASRDAEFCVPEITDYQIHNVCREYARGDVIALDQLTSPFSPRKATKMSPLFSTKYGVSIYISIYTRVISWCLTSGEIQYAIGLVYIKNQYVVEDPSGKAADVFPAKQEGLKALNRSPE